MAVELTSRPTGAEPPEMLDLFSIDGEMYQVPAKPRVHLALRYLDNLRRSGPVIADMMLLEQLIGEKAYQALCAYEDLRPADLSKITDTVVSLTLGAMETGADDDDEGEAKSSGNGVAAGSDRSGG